MKRNDFYGQPIKPEIKKAKKKGYGKFIFRLILFIVLLGIIGYGIYLTVIYFQGKSFIDRMDDGNSITEISIGEDEIVTVDDKDLSVNKSLPNNWVNILLLGGDSRTKSSRGLSDSIIIASVNKDTGEIKLTSIMRDSWVKLPDKNKYNKINSANAYGGPKYAIKTVNENFKMNISKYVFINFFGFPYAIDKIGGVNVDIKQFEVKFINTNINDLPKSKYPKNTNFSLLKQFGPNTHLTGIQALGYARIRHADSDFIRTQRQRNVLFAMLKKIKSQGKSFNLPSTIAAVLPMTETNLNAIEITNIGSRVLKSNIDTLKEFRIPAENTYDLTSVDGMSVIKGDNEKNTELLHDFIYK